MGNLFTSLLNAGNSMRVFERGIGVVQGNVANASTPGFARQQQALEAMRFDPDQGLPGGVASGGTIDSRSQFAERLVRQRRESFGRADERSTQLTRLEPVFDIADDSGLNAALNRFFQAASALSVTPNDTSARKVLLDRARDLAGNFNSLSDSLASSKETLGKALTEQVGRLESIAADVVSINRQFREDFRAQNDPGLQSRLNNLLEEMSEIADVNVIRAEDGSATVYLGGQSLLVIGDRQYDISADVGGETAQVLDWQGNDVAGIIREGRVAALLELRNTTIPGYQAQMDRMAQSLADEVNTVLGGGVDLNGQSPAQPLFTYDTTSGVARSLQVSDLLPAELGLADPASPGGNAGALQLTALGKSAVLDGFTYSQYYGGVAADAGRVLSASKEELRTENNLLSQSRQLRDEVQAVDLNEEALVLLQYQRAYEAAAQMIRTLDEMTQTAISMLR